MVIEPAEIVGFFEPSLWKDSGLWRNTFGDIYNVAELDAPTVNSVHSLAMTDRLLPDWYEPTNRLSTYILDELLITSNGWLNCENAAPHIAQPVGVRIVSQRANIKASKTREAKNTNQKNDKTTIKPR